MSQRPVSVLISALGGEGGGVMSEWLVAAAQHADLPVQGTSIPGVAQRTGATTFMVELYPVRHKELGGAVPVFALYPTPGEIDVMIATELVEAGRACQNGFVTPDRTTLIASTRRFYAVLEKAAMGDGRVDANRVLRAVQTLPQKAVLFDLEKMKGVPFPINAVMFGALCASGKVPIAEEHFREAIRESGISVENNLKGFDFGMKLAREGVPPELAPRLTEAPESPVLDELRREAAQKLPPQLLVTAGHALERLVDYQNPAYARLYIERLAPIAALDSGDYQMSEETAKHLALWMAFEDIVRVAQIKSSSKRVGEVRKEVRAKDDEPVHLIEHFKPGIEEVSALLPPSLGRKLRDWGEHTGRIGNPKWHVAMKIDSSTIFGFMRLWLLARLRFWRPKTFRFAEEQEMIGRWLDAIAKAAPKSTRLAREIAACARLLKGYSDTYRRGRQNFHAIFDRMVVPAVSGTVDPAHAAWRIAAARDAALKDPDGAPLRTELETGLGGQRRPAALAPAE